MELKILLGDNIELLKQYPDNYYDSVVTDCPYGLGKEPNALKLLQDWIDHGYHEIKGSGFMGKSWDAFVPQPLFWKECYRVLKPGCYCLSFFGTRTYDWGVMAMRLAGFQVRDQIDWIYGSGFPKSKASLKPAHEPIAVCRKPGAKINLNIDECRIEVSENDPELDSNRKSPRLGATIGGNGKYSGGAIMTTSLNKNGRWPTNIIMDEAVAELLDEQTGCLNESVRIQGSVRKKNPNGIYPTLGAFKALPKESYNDFGGASRFFYCAKSSQFERNAGCDNLEAIKTNDGREVDADNAFQRGKNERKNFHPTIKPIELMRWLQRLVTPKGGKTLDPFAGSGTSGCSAYFEDIGEIVLMEMDVTYFPIIEARTRYWSNEKNRSNYLEEIRIEKIESIENQMKLFE